MTEFLKTELNRLVQLLPVTDPRTPDYHVLMQSIECLDSLGSTVEGILTRVFDDPEASRPAEAKVVQLPVAPYTAAEFPEDTGSAEDEGPRNEPVQEPAPAKTYEASDVRAALVEAKGKGVDVKAILASVGASNFQGVPADKYGEVMKQLGVM